MALYFNLTLNYTRMNKLHMNINQYVSSDCHLGHLG